MYSKAILRDAEVPWVCDTALLLLTEQRQNRNGVMQGKGGKNWDSKVKEGRKERE